MRATFCNAALVQRCRVHKMRNILEYADITMLVAALRARDRQLGFSVAQAERQIA